MSEYRKQLDERIRKAPPLTTEEALEALERLRWKAEEVGAQNVHVGLDDASLRVLREKYIRPVREALRRL